MTTGGRRRPDSRPSRLRCFFASRRVEPLIGADVVGGIVRLAHVHHGVRRVVRGQDVAVHRAATALAAATAAKGTRLATSGIARLSIVVGVGVVGRAVVRAALAVGVVIGRDGLAPATASGVATTAGATVGRRLVAIPGERGIGRRRALGHGAGVGGVRLGDRAGTVNAAEILVAILVATLEVTEVAGPVPPPTAPRPTTGATDVGGGLLIRTVVSIPDAGAPGILGPGCTSPPTGPAAYGAGLSLVGEAPTGFPADGIPGRLAPRSVPESRSPADGVATDAGGWKSTCGGWKSAAGTAGTADSAGPLNTVGAGATPAAWPVASLLLSVSWLLRSLSSIRAISSQASGRGRTRGDGAPHGSS